MDRIDGNLYVDGFGDAAAGLSVGATTSPVAAREEPIFDAILTPHRSLSRAGFRWLMLALGAVSIALGAAFASAGAWPVVGFFGLDVALVYVAFQASYRSGRVEEAVTLTDAALTVRRRDGGGRESRWEVAPPHWTRVRLDEPVQHHSQLQLVSHGRTTTIGSFLAPEERAELAEALRGALKQL